MAQSIVDDTAEHEELLNKWTSYLSLTSEAAIDADLKEALVESLVRLRSDERYRNDDRYVKLWMRYADSTDDASKVFQMLRSHDIGTQLALFWVAWAYVLETGEVFNEAFEVLSQGKIRGAQPATLLEEFEGAFCKRMWERMRLARSKLSNNVTCQKDMVRVSVKTGGPDGKPCSSTTREQLIDSSIPLTSPSTSSRSTEGARFSSGPEAEPLLDLAVDGKLPHLFQNQKHALNLNQVGEERTKSVDRKQAEVDGMGTRRTRRKDGNVELAGRPLRERDGNIQALKQPRLRDPGKKRAPVDKKFFVINDPFSLDVWAGITVESAQYVRWASSRNGRLHHVRHESLAKRWPRKMGNVRLGSRRRILSSRTLGTQRLEVMGILGEGGYATVYACKVDDARRYVAVKVEFQVEMPSLPWECFVTLQLRDRLLRQRQDSDPTRLQPEVEVIAPGTLHIFRDGCAMTMPLGRSGTVHDLVVLYQKHSKSMPQLVAMHYTIQMLRFCRVMHSASILHMDIKPDNWLLTSSSSPAYAASPINRNAGAGMWGNSHSVSLIDFGRAIDLSTFPDDGSGVSFSGNCCPSSFSCPAMFEGRAWKYDADLFALGSCVYFMLHGVYLEICCDEVQDCGSVYGSVSSGRGRRWRPKKRCRRYWEVDLWNKLFDDLLNGGRWGNDRADAEEVLIRLESSLTSFLVESRRSLELAELLKRQESMICSNRWERV